MDRTRTMSRFLEPEEPKGRKMANCSGCDGELYEGEEVIQVDDDIYCNFWCLNRMATFVTL